MAGRGRPTKLTPELQAEIVQAVFAGNYIETAVQAVGIHKDTYYEWLKKGAEGRDPYVDFADAVKQAESQSEVAAVARVVKGETGAMSCNWTSAMTWLERRFPSRWSRRDPDHGLKTKLLKAELETLRAKLKMLEQGQDPDEKQITVVIPALPENPLKADR